MIHPIQAYLNKHGITRQDFLARCARLGMPMSPVYLYQIMTGRRYFQRDRAITLSEITNGEVSVGALMEYPPHQPKPKPRKPAKVA